MFLECNNHEAHGPTDYHAYATISKRQKQFLWTYVTYMYVMTSATDSFNIHTSLVWQDPSLSLHMHVSSKAITMHVCTHAIQRMEREGSSHTS